MHEYGIAQEMVSLALQQVPPGEPARITQFTIEMSRAADESEDSLRFYLENLTRGTRAEGAVFEIQRVPIPARCLECGRTFDAVDLLEPCPHCASARVMHEPSDEFKLSSIDIE